MYAMARLTRAVFALALFAPFLPSLVLARPVILTEDARIAPSDPDVAFEQVAVDGDNLLALGLRYTDTGMDQDFIVAHYARQTDGSWQFVSEVLTVPDAGNWLVTPSIALSGNVGSVTLNGTYAAVLELTTSGWTVAPITLPGPTSGTKIVDSAVAFGFRGAAPMSVALVRKNTSGTWAIDEVLTGLIGSQEPEWIGPSDFSLTNSEAALSGTWEGPSPLVFDRVNGQWTLTQLGPWDDGTLLFDGRVALRDGGLSVPGEVASFYTRDIYYAFTVKHGLFSEEAYEDRRPVTMANGLIAQGDRVFSADYRCDTISVASVYEPDSSSSFRHAATLAASDSYYRGCGAHPISASGNRVAIALGAVYVFDVPETLPSPVRIEDTFASGSTANWTTLAGTWAVQNIGGSNVYRQSYMDGTGRTILGPSVFQGAHQSIQADVTMHSGAGPGPWAGFILRYNDPQNYYYLLVDQDSIDIRRIVNGVFEPIATAPFKLVMGKRYRLRMEAIGERLRAYVDGQVVADVRDDTHADGQVGLITWKMLTDYDNVVASTNYYATLHADDFSSATTWSGRSPWFFAPQEAWTYGSGFLQQTTNGIARAVAGGPAEDQIVTAAIVARSFQSKDGWVGVLARYVDENNYYYVAWKNDGKLSLRKRVNGVITKIKEVPMKIQPNTSYQLRFEAIGNSLRLYVDEKFVAEATETDFAEGRYGVMTDRAVVDVFTFRAMRP